MAGSRARSRSRSPSSSPSRSRSRSRSPSPSRSRSSDRVFVFCSNGSVPASAALLRETTNLVPCQQNTAIGGTAVKTDSSLHIPEVSTDSVKMFLAICRNISVGADTTQIHIRSVEEFTQLIRVCMYMMADDVFRVCIEATIQTTFTPDCDNCTAFAYLFSAMNLLQDLHTPDCEALLQKLAIKAVTQIDFSLITHSNLDFMSISPDEFSQLVAAASLFFSSPDCYAVPDTQFYVALLSWASFPPHDVDFKRIDWFANVLEKLHSLHFSVSVAHGTISDSINFIDTLTPLSDSFRLFMKAPLLVQAHRTRAKCASCGDCECLFLRDE